MRSEIRSVDGVDGVDRHARFQNLSSTLHVLRREVWRVWRHETKSKHRVFGFVLHTSTPSLHGGAKNPRQLFLARSFLRSRPHCETSDAVLASIAGRGSWE